MTTRVALGDQHGEVFRRAREYAQREVVRSLCVYEAQTVGYGAM